MTLRPFIWLLVCSASFFSDLHTAHGMPPGIISVARDTCANEWGLREVGAGTELVVQPAQAPNTWIRANIPGIAVGAWTGITTDSDCTVTVSSATISLRFDVRSPQQLTRLVPSSSANDSPMAASPWRVVARMPASNHDLSAAVLDGQLFIAGGSTTEWGFPVQTRAFDELWQLDANSWQWHVAARFSLPRIFCSTVAFGSKIWVIGGDVQDQDGQRRASTRVDIFDPRTGELSPGPELSIAQPAPLAVAARGRLYVVGSAGRNQPGIVESIGRDEKQWRREPDGPSHMWAVAGAAIDDVIYVCIPQTGLVAFDPGKRTWTTIPSAGQPRSPQVAAWRGELWIVGGRDVRPQSTSRIYNPQTRRWREGPAFPRDLAWGAAGVLNNQLVITGGAAGNNYSDRTFALSAADAPMPEITVPVPTAYGIESVAPWDGRRFAGTGSLPLATTTVPAFPGLKLRRPVSILTIPSKDNADLERLLVIESDGPISTFRNDPAVRQNDVMLNLPAHFRNAVQTYALAFHPRFPAVPFVYVLYNHLQPKPSENVLARFTVTAFSPLRAEPRTEEVLMRWPSDGHNGGDLKFGPDGFLYVSTGDGSSPGDPRNMGQRVDVISGGILRLDVDRRPPGKNYAVPPDNPFVGLPDVLPEYWAYGLRNPWRMNFTPAGDLWVGDNGDDSWDSVHLVRKGHNYGWSTFEGSHPFKRNLPLRGPTPTATTPVIELSHAEARSVIGGLVYRGDAIPELKGQYLFGDYVTGLLWAFAWNGKTAENFRRIAETGGRPLAFGEERSREVLMARLDGQIHRLVPALARATTTAPVPRRLSETGLFASTAEQRPAAGVIPYVINASLWSDGADARRLLALPANGKIGLNDERQNWKLPDGAAVTRTLELPSANGPIPVETQVMVREQGRWQFYSYAWNAAQTDAELIDPAGETRPVHGLEGRTWRFVSRTECTVCHTSQSDFVLGLSTRQLNREADYSAVGGSVANQIATLAQLGVFDRAPSFSAKELPTMARPDDFAARLDDRARAYLHVNCAHCHRPDGVGGRAAFQLLDNLPLAKTGLINGHPLVPLLGPQARLIRPGDPDGSEILHRMTLREGGRMPLLGSAVHDNEGTSLIRQWILSMASPPLNGAPPPKPASR